MAIKKIFFRDLFHTGYVCIAGIRFYNDGEVIDTVGSGVISSNFNEGETEIIKVKTAGGTFQTANYHVLHSFDTSRPQDVNLPNFWLGYNNQKHTLELEFKKGINSIDKIEFIPVIDSDRGIQSPFIIEVQNENNEIMQSYTVTPIKTVGVIQSLSTDEISKKNRSLFKSNSKIYSLKPNEILHETKMTSNTAPAPFVASASSVNSTTYPAWKAFNGTLSNNTDCWASALNVTNAKLTLDFGEKKKVNAFKLTARLHETLDVNVYTPRDFNILASNDGINFYEIAKIREQSNWGSAEERLFPMRLCGYWRYFTLEVLSINGATTINVGKLEYFYIENLTQLPSDSVDNFINYGSSSIEHFNLINNHKNYILQDTVSENADGLWVQEIDRKPLSIKFE